MFFFRSVTPEVALGEYIILIKMELHTCTWINWALSIECPQNRLIMKVHIACLKSSTLSSYRTCIKLVLNIPICLNVVKQYLFVLDQRGEEVCIACFDKAHFSVRGHCFYWEEIHPKACTHKFEYHVSMERDIAVQKSVWICEFVMILSGIFYVVFHVMK